MSLRAAARLMNRMANASGVIADNFERSARAAAGGVPLLGQGSARGSSSGAGGAGGPGGPGGAGGNGGGGGGSTGPVASTDALRLLERIWFAIERGNLNWEKAMPPGTMRRMSR